MKIIGMCGSPRKRDAEFMLTEVLKGAKPAIVREAKAETGLILLREKSIQIDMFRSHGIKLLNKICIAAEISKKEELRNCKQRLVRK